MTNCKTLKNKSQHIVYLYIYNNVAIHFTFIEIKET